MYVISYRKTIVGWYNFKDDTGFTFNVAPELFRNLTGVSEKATMGCAELKKEEYAELMAAAKLIKLAEGFEWVS